MNGVLLLVHLVLDLADTHCGTLTTYVIYCFIHFTKENFRMVKPTMMTPGLINLEVGVSLPSNNSTIMVLALVLMSIGIHNLSSK